MEFLSEEHFREPFQKGCEIRARIVVDNYEKPLYLLVDDNASLTTRVLQFLKSSNIQCDKGYRIDYVLHSSEEECFAQPPKKA